MVRLLLLCSLLLPTHLCATQVFQSKDKFGRPVFSDTAPDTKHQSITIEIQNDYDWHKPDFSSLRKKSQRNKRKKRRRKQQPKYSLAQLQGKCQSARYRYQTYRGTKNSNNWGSYKAKLIKYAERRDYWCSRALKRK